MRIFLIENIHGEVSEEVLDRIAVEITLKKRVFQPRFQRYDDVQGIELIRSFCKNITYIYI